MSTWHTPAISACQALTWSPVPQGPLSRFDIARKVAVHLGVVEDSLDIETCEGAATIGLELADTVPSASAVDQKPHWCSDGNTVAETVLPVERMWMTGWPPVVTGGQETGGIRVHCRHRAACGGLQITAEGCRGGSFVSFRRCLRCGRCGRLRPS